MTIKQKEFLRELKEWRRFYMKKEELFDIIDELVIRCEEDGCTNLDVYKGVKLFSDKLKDKLSDEMLDNPTKHQTYIVVEIKDIDYINILFREDFIDGNEFKTQNMIIAVLNTLGFKEPKVMICGRDFIGDE